MKIFRSILLKAFLIFLLASMFCGCAYEPAREYIQNDPNTMIAPNTPTIPENLVGKTENAAGNSKISATYEVVDFSYITTDQSALNVRTGAGTKYPSIGTVRSGQKIRALGKLDGWYVVKMPDTGRIGCIPSANTKLYSDGTKTTDTGMATKTETKTPSPDLGNITGGKAETGAKGTGTMSSDESRILQLVNEERSKAGVKVLISSGDCTKLARMKSQDMADNNYFSHQSPTYGSPFDMLKANKVNYMYAGENIAINQTAEAAFKSWMNSEGHKKNILNPNFTELGVGISPKANGSYIFTQLFIGR